jgi:plasmid stabilization system protein ParE
VKSYRLVIRPDAGAELAEGARWYEARTRGLGREFVRAFRAATEPLRRNPFMFQIVVGEARRTLLRRFPYSIFYEIHGSDVVILACFHEARDPDEWQHRITSQAEEDRV